MWPQRMESKLDRIGRELEQLWNELGPELRITKEFMRRHEILLTEWGQALRDDIRESREEWRAESRAHRQALFAMLDRLSDGGGGAAPTS